MSGSVVNVQMDADVLVIGSGAAGSVIAFEMARAGRRTVVLERGRRADARTFAADEIELLPQLFKRGGLQATSDGGTLIVQGATVGGSTVVGGAVWCRPDVERLLSEWSAFGANVPRPALMAAFEEIEQALQVAPMPPELANRGTRVFVEGCRQLGIEIEYPRQNRVDCRACGSCNFGCPHDRKMSALVTYVPWAEERGATFLDACDGVRVVTEGQRARGARCHRDGVEIEVRAPRVVLCAGAIGSSEILLRSGINLDGRVGRGLHLLGGVTVAAECREQLDSFDGIPMTAFGRASDRYLLQSTFAPPVVFAANVGGWFASHYDRVLRYSHYTEGTTMVASEPVGRVTLDRTGNAQIDFTFGPGEVDRLRAGVRRLAEIFFAGGAVRVVPAIAGMLEFSCLEDLDSLPDYVRTADDLLLASAYPQGGNPMSDDPTRGVVGSDFRVHGYDNLFVADASVFPTNTRVHCQATVMALARVAAESVRGDGPA